MRRHSKVILLAEEQLVFGLPPRDGGRERQSQERRAEKPVARFVGLADRAEKSGTPTACKPMGLVS
jgi:hypothetical protein